MATQYEYGNKAEAVAKKKELERLGVTVFTPYYQPLTRRADGMLVGGTWNIIFPSASPMR